MRALWRAIWREPRPVGVPPVGRADWVLVGGFEAAAVLEGIARPGFAGQPYVTLLAMIVMPVLLWRRQHPLTTCLLGFGVAGLLSVIQLVTDAADLGPSSMMVVLILLYSLARWGSGREIAVGLPCVAAVVALGMDAAAADLAEIIGGSLLLLLVVSLAAIFRARADLWQRQRREIRNAERLALARELHDTVAHHISAIAVQAQAGGVVVRAQPAQAAVVLATIEAEAVRTLAEMRAMVRVLREEGWDAYAPRPGVADLRTLARADATPVVDVSVDEAVTGLPGPVDAAVYRIAQEALTNAVRHARRATHVGIDVCRVADDVRLRVTDDGLTPAGPGAPAGFGLTGMAERVHLLGGSFHAGPALHGGWVVEAVLPVRVSR
ncbi:MAG: histidine kinase [Austwickia sp.]|nr:histidine kinase [Actinomycetota bacterium]MCO5307941.1 histidine kinase [Austwickia sp.]